MSCIHFGPFAVLLYYAPSKTMAFKPPFTFGAQVSECGLKSKLGMIEFEDFQS